jgi:hypothetical protein
MLGCTLEEADSLLTLYWATLKQAAVYCENVRNQARRREYVETYFGRKRRLPDINASDWKKKGKAEREAVNTAIQGTAADLMKIALVRAAAGIKQNGFKSRLCLVVHDELLVAHHPDDNLDALSEIIRESFEISQPGWCVIKSAAGYGPNWQDIDDFDFPSRRPNGVAAPSQLLSPIVLEPASMRDEVLTVTFGATTTSEVASNLQLEVAARPGGSRLILVMPDGSEHRYPTGVRVDRKFLMQMRAENLEYTFSPLLHERLLKESSGR